MVQKSDVYVYINAKVLKYKLVYLLYSIFCSDLTHILHKSSQPLLKQMTVSCWKRFKESQPSGLVKSQSHCRMIDWIKKHVPHVM